MKVFLLILCLLLVGKNQKGTKKTASADEKTMAYVFAEKDIYIVNLQQNTVNKIHSPSKIKDVILSKDTIWIAGTSLFRLNDKELIEEMELPPDYKQIVKSGGNFYILRKEEILQLPDRRRLMLSETPIKFDISTDNIWLLDEEGFSIYRRTDFKELYRIPLEKPLDFELTPYGIRLYIASIDRLNIFDAQNANYITDIQIETEGRALLKIAKDKLYCLTGTKLYKIDKTTNQIEKCLQVEGGKQLFISRAGKYGAILRDSITTFFDAEKGEITKNISLKAMDIATTLQDSRIYCLTPEELVVINPEKLQTIHKLKLSGGRKIIIK